MAKRHKATPFKGPSKKWERFSAELAPNHGWRASPGHMVFCAGNGALMFEVPSGWIVTPQDNWMKISDKAPPDDDYSFQVTVMQFPPIKMPPLRTLVTGFGAHHGNPISEDRIVEGKSLGAEWAWWEYTLWDEYARKEAVWRTCMCRGRGVNGVISFGFWPENRARGEAIWNHVFETLQVEQFFTDVSKGPILH